MFISHPHTIIQRCSTVVEWSMQADLSFHFDENELDVIDWVLALFYASWKRQDGGGGLPSGVHVQGALYIMSKYNPRLRDILEFKAHGGGPWSEEVYDALVLARVNGWIMRSRRGLLLSSRGRQIAEDTWARLDKKEKEMLMEIVNIVNRMSREELLLYICILYGCPNEVEANENIYRGRKRIAVNMLRKNLVSVELASKIAGVPLPLFIGYLKKQGHKPYTVEAGDPQNT